MELCTEAGDNSRIRLRLMILGNLRILGNITQDIMAGSRVQLHLVGGNLGNYLAILGIVDRNIRHKDGSVGRGGENPRRKALSFNRAQKEQIVWILGKQFLESFLKKKSRKKRTSQQR